MGLFQSKRYVDIPNSQDKFESPFRHLKCSVMTKKEWGYVLLIGKGKEPCKQLYVTKDNLADVNSDYNH